MRTSVVLRSFESVLLSGLAAAVASCAGPGSPDRDVSSASEAAFEISPKWRWPTDFADQKAVLVADELLIEGPQGLLEHLVVRQSSRVQYETVVTSRGLEQRFHAKDDEPGVIRAELDRWVLSADRRLVATERSDLDGPIRIEATGRATWQLVDGGSKRKGPRLVFTAQPLPPEPNQ